MKRIAILGFIGGFLLLSSACNVTDSRYRTPAEQASAMLQLGIQKDETLYQASQNAQLPFQIKKALIPGLESSESVTSNNNMNDFSNLYGKKFNINVTNIDATLFFKNLAKAVPYSIVVDPNVTGNITLKLKNVSITDILEALRDVYGYDYRQTTYGFLVLPAELQTQTFHVNYLDIVRNSSSYTQISSDELTNVLPSTTSGDITNNSSTSTTSSNNGTGTLAPTAQPAGGISQSQVNTTSRLDFWKDLTASLQAYIGTDKGRSIVVNPLSGTIVVKAFPNEIRQVSEFLDQIQSNMSREVVLEVKLLEVQLNDQYSAGINWDVFGFKQGSIKDAVSNSVVTDSPLTTINIHGNNFANVMRLLEEQGNIQTIANPRVLTVNNQQAVIRIGTDQFFVTGITTNVNNSGTTNTVTTASVNLTPFFSGVILDITPQISRNGEILLHLHPVVSSVESQTKKINIGATSPMELPLAKNTIREYDSIVRAQNQQVVMIGGLTQNTLREDVQSTPGISHIPFFGALFRNTGQSSAKVELVILLKPTILGRGRQVMSEQLPLATQRIDELDRGFHAGTLPELFGNESEKYNLDSPRQNMDE